MINGHLIQDYELQHMADITKIVKQKIESGKTNPKDLDSAIRFIEKLELLFLSKEWEGCR